METGARVSRACVGASSMETGKSSTHGTARNLSSEDPGANGCRHPDSRFQTKKVPGASGAPGALSSIGQLLPSLRDVAAQAIRTRHAICAHVIREEEILDGIIAHEDCVYVPSKWHCNATRRHSG